MLPDQNGRAAKNIAAVCRDVMVRRDVRAARGAPAHADPTLQGAA